MFKKLTLLFSLTLSISFLASNGVFAQVKKTVQQKPVTVKKATPQNKPAMVKPMIDPSTAGSVRVKIITDSGIVIVKLYDSALTGGSLTRWAMLPPRGEFPGPECVEVDFSDASGSASSCFEPCCGGGPVLLITGAWHVVADGQLPTVERVGVGGTDTARRGHDSSRA